ncbi:DHHW family protein [Ureibacillus aquaedulcis]|uniref:DHHW family protein n=1 Tax=Ureibacillus aquaedulcis TaxID=3058421 RepID=A0ABT8GL75_9BACL|nr:DHHW family protein [Ureibacillus sp. BA0131]MDN4492171.1 DHHW family protein [Ureibacillus sp. BA0131]
MKKLSNYLTILLFIGFIIGVGAYIQLSEKEDISFYENRTLAKNPEVSVEKFVDGSYTKEYETYITDHFAAKDTWIKGYIQWQRLTNQTFIQDYYISKEDNWIYPKPASYVDYAGLDKTVANMEGLAEYTDQHNMELFLFSLPNRYLILDPDYPSFITHGYEYEQKEYYLDGLSKVDNLHLKDVAQDFRNNFTEEEVKELYYQTDHHWNVDGAFEGYKVIYNTLNEQSEYFNEPSLDKEAFSKKCYDNNNFIGSYNRQLYQLVKTEDAICSMIPSNVDFNTWEVYKGGISEETKTIWSNIYGSDLEKENEHNVTDYAGIFTADYKELTVINPAKEKEGIKALFIKDSYANPMTFWLPEHFYQTTFYDMRYNNNRSLYEYLENNEFDMIVFLYNDTTVNSVMYDFSLEEKTE